MNYHYKKCDNIISHPLPITLFQHFTMEPNHHNLDSNHEEFVPLFEQFPPPFFNDMLYNHHKHPTSNTANEPTPSPTKTKRVRKKRSAGKNDRHSKIHTAQGLRDRRMRLSVNIAHKFFGLQDMLGFDKASKTIEWLFCKSKEAIDEVTKSVKPQNTTQSACDSPFTDCEVDSGIEFDATSNKKGKQLLINNLDKPKHMFGANPNDDVNQLLLGFSTNPNNHFIKDSSSSLLEYSGMHHDHFFDHTQLYNVGKKTDDYTGNAAANLTTYFANPPVGWLDSNNPFSGFLDNFTENYELNYPNLAPSTGDVNGQNFGSVLIPPSNLVYLQTQNQRD
ncbi:hypothetical protein QVD17_20963 [Tagetes erecta]|uniref:TCP domain-containing protein n=1 Tax=Tagetes erecta TaxID=13708 RepID=A0AAD8KM76_TARER|nr:hypothetical protein QVD17_20963 [Tagetes erecta]